MKYDIARYNHGSGNSQGKILSLVRPDSTVLEMGAATGYMTKELREAKNCDVSIVEIDPEGFAQARQYATDGYCGDLNKDEWFQTFEGKQFDYILFADVLEHLQVPAKALKKSVELLKKDGTILISIPNIGHNDILLKLATDEWNYTATGLLDDTHVHFWGRENLDSFINEAGLKMVLLDGTYLGTCDTEQFRATNSAVDVPLYNILSQRPLGEVYQFIIAAQKAEWVEKQGIEMQNMLPGKELAKPAYGRIECESTVFFAGQDGYSAANCTTQRRKVFGQGNLALHISWDLKVPQGCNRVRLDPCENWYCIVDQVKVLYAGQMIQPVPINGFALNEYLVFPTEDPQLEIPLSDDLGRNLHIDMQCQLLDARNPLLFSIKKYMDEMKKALEDRMQLISEGEQRQVELIQKINDIEAERAACQQQMEKMTQTHDQECKAYEAHADELIALRLQEKETLLKDIEELKADREAREKEHSQESEVLRASISNLEQELEQQKETHDQECKAYEAHADELIALRLQEKETLLKDIEELKSDREAREKEHSQENEVLRASISNLEQELEQQKETHDQECKAYEAHADELIALRLQEKETLLKDIEELKSDREAREKGYSVESGSLRASISSLEQRLKLQQEAHDQKCRMYEERAALSDSQHAAEMHSLKHQHESEVMAGEAERQAVLVKLEALEQRNVAEKRKTRRLAEKYARENQHLAEKVQTYKKQLDDSKANAYQMGKYQVERSGFLTRIAELESLHQHDEQCMAARTAEMNQQIAQLENQCTARDRHLEMREAEMARQVAQLEEQCRAYDRHIAAMQAENQGRLQQAFAERDVIAERVRAFEEENQALRAANQKYQYDFLLISNSQWWKLTAPGRRVLSAVKETKAGGLLFKGLRSIKSEGIKTATAKTMSHFGMRKAGLPVVQQASGNAFISQLQKHAGVIVQPEKMESYLGQTKPYQYRVLFVSHEMSLTGAPVVLLNFAKNVHNSGNQAVIVAPVDGPLRKEAEKCGIPVAIVPDLFAAGDALELAYPFNAVVACTIASAAFVRELNGTDIPVIWWIHEAMVSYHPGFLMNMPQELKENVHVYSVCEYAKDMLLKFRPQYHSDVLPYYMDDFADVESKSSFTLPKHGTKKVFTMVGTMEERKGQDILVKAIRLLPKNILEKCLFVIVAKKYHKPYEEMIDALCKDYPQNVIYYEQLSRDEISNLYKESDCQICASRDDPLPCVITEALAVGKPAICSEHTGYAAILQEMNSGLVYRNDNPRLLAEAIEKYISKPTLQKKLQRNTRKTYEKYFTKEVFAQKSTEILYKTIFRLRAEELEGANVEQMSTQQLVESFTPKEKSVSVVIPAYNAGSSFDALLSSLEKQKGVDSLEIVIVDSGSTDGTVETCKQHGVRLIQISNAEFSHSGARNMGAEAATGEIILFMTQDALPAGNNWIEKLIEPIMLENVAAVSPREKCPENTDLYYRVASHIHITYLGTSKQDLLNEGMEKGDRAGFRARSALNDVTTVINRKVFLRFMYRHNFAEDLDMGMRLVRGGYRVKLMSNVQTIHGHNRAAGYYFKRTLVDTLTTSETIMQMPVAGTANQADLADMLGQGYGAMQWVYSTLLSDEYPSLKKFHAAFIKTMNAAKTLSAEEMKSAQTNSEMHDDILQSVASILNEFCSQLGAPRYEVINAMQGYWENVLHAYAEENLKWTKNTAKELLICINKQLACTLGCELARLSPSDSMYPQIHQFAAGV